MRTTLALTWLLTSACTSYTYYAREQSTDSRGEQRELLAYWRVSERALWFDESSEGVVVKLQCSTHALDFEEGPNGIVFRSDGSWEGAREQNGVLTCGRVEGIERVKDVRVGDSLTVDLWCTPAEDEFAVATPFLPPGKYVFTRVARAASDVDVPACPAAAARTETVSLRSAPN